MIADSQYSSRWIRDRSILLDAVREAGALARDRFRSSLKVWNKRPNDPVSDADIAVNRLLHKRLAGVRPDYGWLSEESRDNGERLEARRVWIVDPIDGTRAFVRGHDEFSISVALVEQGRPVLAAVLSPMRDELFWAEAGQGAYLNDTAIEIGDRHDLEGARMLADPQFFQKARHWPVQWPALSYTRMNSIALRMVLVACGRHDAVVTIRPKSDWDLAAADLIVTEAGGCCVDEDGRPLVYNEPRPVQRNVIACNTELLEAILTRVKPAVLQWRARQVDADRSTAQK